MSKPSATRPAVRLTRRTTVALGALALAASLIPERAHAGLYTVVQCHPGFAAGAQDATFTRTSRDYLPSSACAKGGPGLRVGHRRSHTLTHRWGGWRVAAPAGAALVKAAVRVSGLASGGLVPQLLAGGRGKTRTFGHAEGRPHRAAWRGVGTELVARLRCERPRSCAPDRAAKLAVKRIRLRLRDVTRPTLGLTGPLFEPGARRGVVGLDATAADGGAGVSQISVDVNGSRASTRGIACALVRGVGVRVQPCPAASTQAVVLDTTRPPFRQGANRVRVCASDLATSGPANAACESRRVRIDNACPLSGTSGGQRLTLRLAGTRGHGLVARGDHPAAVGRLTDTAGSGIRGARVCVATRARLPGAPEHVVATPATDGSGHFRAALPSGPSRRIRVAYWGDASGALERFARIRVRARPRLELHPKGKLRNGDRMRMLVRLPAPATARRIVKVEARAGGRWLPVAAGRTGQRGVYRTSYRFHATARRRVYRFRALVPRQRGYPYAPGLSAVKRKVVSG
jgi:hypothetical protein